MGNGEEIAMATLRRNQMPNVEMLRAEARLLTTAGLILLAIGFPLTMTLVALALSPDGISPIAPLTIGGAPILLGYLACHFASVRLAKARDIEQV
jgi:hypothetical protein